MQVELDFYPKPLLKLPTLGTENSCYFHAILQGCNPSYQERKSAEYRTQLARILRNLIAEKLASTTEDGTLSYSKLSVANFDYEDYTLKNLISTLKSCEPVDHSFQEIICDILGIDIYLLGEKDWDIYRLANEEKLYIKGRKSVILTYQESSIIGHYSLLGRMGKNGTIQTLFDPNDELVECLKERIRLFKNE